MTVQMKLNLGNAPQVMPLAGGMFGAQQLVLTFGVLPSGGTVTIEVMPVGGTQWLAIKKSINLPVSGAPYFIRSAGWINQVRVTFNGVVGGSDAWLWAEQVELPPGLFEGFAAITTQPYTEANVKNGVQFNLRAAWPLTDVIATGTSRKLWFQTTSKPVIVKLREFQYLAEEMRIELFSGPSAPTGGTNLAIHNYNGVNPVATTVAAKKNVTIANNGTAFDTSDPEYFFGGANDPQRQAASSIPVGRERILPSNSTFAVVITNTGGGNARAQYFLDWYEGGTDLPL